MVKKLSKICEISGEGKEKKYEIYAKNAEFLKNHALKVMKLCKTSS